MSELQTELLNSPKVAGRLAVIATREGADVLYGRGTHYVRTREACPPRWLPLWDACSARVSGLVLECGRGSDAQTSARRRGASRARFGESPHSWKIRGASLAVDVYGQKEGVLVGVPDLDLICKRLGLVCGRTWARPDPPHVEVRDWPLVAFEAVVAVLEARKVA
ncbi:MAG TPA: hypothetical protein EYN66_13065 [Myxococcales bacterium]|nr:hypothetical protein [Myxococcales bacterium]